MTDDCCGARKKIILAIVAVLPESECGVPDSTLVDFIRFDVQHEGKSLIVAPFCCWCGKRRDPNIIGRVTPPPFTKQPPLEGEEWKGA